MAVAKAKVKAQSKALVPWKEQLKREAEKVAKREQSSDFLPRIRTSNGVLQYGGQEVKELTLLVLDSQIANEYYEGRYDPNNPAPPVCFAFSAEDADDDSLAPHDAAPDKQADTCNNCEYNRFGSAETGKGKACKNIRRLVVTAVDDASDLLDAPQMAYLAIPVTSVRAWSQYVRGIESTLELPPHGVLTTVKIEPSKKDQFHLTFTVDSELEFDEDSFAALNKMREQAREILNTPYTRRDPDEQPVARPRNAPKSKVAPKIVPKAASGRVSKLSGRR